MNEYRPAHTYHWDSIGPGARLHTGPVDECKVCHPQEDQ